MSPLSPLLFDGTIAAPPPPNAGNIRRRPSRPKDLGQTLKGEAADVSRVGCQETATTSNSRKDALPGAASAIAQRTAQFGKLRTLPAATAIVDHYLRFGSLEELMLELFNAPLSLRQIQEMTEEVLQQPLASDAIRDLNLQIEDTITRWLRRPLQDCYPVVFVEGTWLRWKRGAEERCVALLAVIGVDRAGFREVLAVTEGAKEDAADCQALFQSLQTRGVLSIGVAVGDLCSGIRQGLTTVFPRAQFQCCVRRFREAVLVRIKGIYLPRVDAMLRHIQRCDDAVSASRLTDDLLLDLRRNLQEEAADFVARHREFALGVLALPRPLHASLSTIDWLGKIFRALRERTRVVGAISDADTAVLLAGARFRHFSRSQWRHRCYLKPGLLAGLG